MSLIHFSCKCNYSILLRNKTPIYSAWVLLRVCAACPTPRLNQSYELRPPWEQHLRYVPHRVRNGLNNSTPITHNHPVYVLQGNGPYRTIQRGVSNVGNFLMLNLAVREKTARL